MILLLACACLAAAQAVAAVPSVAAPTEAQRMQWFADAKFGIFIHYGIYAVDGIDESWSFYDGYVSYDH
ncbi:MAG: alpha-L-fucosidase, partial [Xanthomonadaceae bacterium]|nr:alpha-L-fucosidase [Xanthomonadaceae bacterium]